MKNNIKNGWGNIVDSIMVLQKGKPYFEVEYSELDPVYAANSFKNKDEVGYYALAKVTGEKRADLVLDLNLKDIIHSMVLELVSTN